MAQTTLLSRAEAALPGKARGHVCPKPARKWVLVSAILASSLGFISASVIAVAIPAIRDSPGASFAEMQWINNAFVLTLSALILVGGAAGDRFGERDVLGVGVGVFVAMSLWCGLAGGAEELIVARAFQGIGAAMMVPGSLALIARNYPAAERGRAIGIWASASGVSAAFGPLVGGGIVTAGGEGAWRWLFFLNLPIGALALLVLFARAPRDGPITSERLDYIGGLLATLSLGLVAFALTRSSESGGGGFVLAAAVAGIAAFAAFLWWESRTRAPMMPLGLFASRGFSGANALTLLLYLALGGALFFLPLTLIEGWGLSARDAGVVFLPFTLVMAGLAQWAGGWADRVGTRLPLTVGPGISGVAFLGLAYAVGTQSMWLGIVPAMVVLGIGLGFAVPVLSTAIMLTAPDEQAGAASGINNAVARVAQLLAVAGLGIVAARAYASGLVDQAGSGLGDREREVLVAAGFGERPENIGQAAASAYRAATVSAFKAVALVTAALAFLSAAIGWFTQAAAPSARTDTTRAGQGAEESRS